MSNSKLATYVKISPFKNSPRNKPISKITWHHMADKLTVQQLGAIITSAGRNMSCTYSIGYDGTIGRHLDEGDRPWTSSSSANDNMAVTIEISNSSNTDSNWPISDHVMARAIELTVDICKRNGIKKLVYTGDSKGNFTYHHMFAPTACPGPYIKSKTDYIVKTINAKLSASSNSTDTPKKPATKPATKPVTPTVKAKDIVSIKSNAKYYDGQSMPSWVKSTEWVVDSVSGDRAILGKSKDCKFDINSPVNTKYITVTKKHVEPAVKPYTAIIKSGVVIYNTPGSTKKAGTIKTTATYTIVDEELVKKTTYCKLKSGAGWVKLSQITKTKKPTSTAIKRGDKVKPLTNRTYDGKTFSIYVTSYTVLEVNGDRVVISADGKNVTAAVNVSNLKKL